MTACAGFAFAAVAAQAIATDARKRTRLAVAGAVAAYLIWAALLAVAA